MFIGEYSHTIDEKGRVAVPKKFRAQLAAGAVVTRGLDGCLFLYAKEDWEKLAERASGLPISNPRARAFQREVIAGGMEVEMDGQGRVTLPSYLRSHAALKGSAIMAGLNDRVEIWDPSRWEEYRAATEGSDGGLADQYGELGI